MRIRNSWFDHVVYVLLDYAMDAREQRDLKPTDFSEGMLQGYRDALGTLKNALAKRHYNLSRCGLDIDIESRYS